MLKISSFYPLLLSISLAGHLSAQEASSWPTANSYIGNGDFSTVQEAGIPAGWERSGEEGEGKMEKMEEDGHSFIRIMAEQPNQLVGFVQSVDVPAGVQGLEFHASFRNLGVKFGKNFLCDARARFGFYDAEGNKLQNPPDVIFGNGAKDWTHASRKFLVPEGAAKLNVLVCLNRPASGTIDVEKVALVAMDEKEAQDLAMVPILAAKKKAEDLAEVQKLIDLPSITSELHVSGNRLINKEGKEVILQGVNVPSLEWSDKGENIHRSLKVALIDWKANVVRLPVAAGFWFGRGKGKQTSNNQETYRAVVDDAVKMAAGQGAYLILDLHHFGGPKEDAVEFWKDAAARYANNPAVLFDLFNETHGITWDEWQKGGEKEVTDKKTKEVSTVQVVGLQTLVDTARSTGAKNILIVGGMGYAYSLKGVLEGHAINEPGGNGIMYATHFYNWHRGWEENFLKVAEQYPVLVGEFGADVKKMSFIPAKNQEDPYTWMPDALGMVQKYKLNWTAFSMHPAATPVLIKNWDYEPTPFFGVFVKDALNGKEFNLEKMR